MAANRDSPSKGHDSTGAELTDGEKAAIELLMDEHDIPGRVPAVSIWNATDSRKQFVKLAEQAADLYGSVAVQVDVPSEVVQQAERQVAFEEEKLGLELTSEEREQLVEERVHDSMRLELQY